MTQDQESTKDVLAINRGVVKFYLLALFIFAAFYAGYTYFVVDSSVFEKYLGLLASLTSQFLNTFLGEESVLKLVTQQFEHKIQVENGIHIVVTYGCDASTVFAVLIATVLAWPSPIWKRLIVTIVGLMLMFGLNILRLVAMMLIEIYHPARFDLMNEWVLPLALVMSALAYFYTWTQLSGCHPDD